MTDLIDAFSSFSNVMIYLFSPILMIVNWVSLGTMN